MIKTTYKVISKIVDPVGLFSKLNQGKEGFLLESADIIKKYGDKSIICTEPCIKIIIKNYKFKIEALNSSGKSFFKHLIKKLKIKKSGFLLLKKSIKINQVTDTIITGVLKRENCFKDEESKLKQTSVFDLLRIFLCFKPKINLGIPSIGLYGMIGYDAIDYFEELPNNKKTDFPDLLFYFVDKLIVMDHIHKKTYLIANSLSKNLSISEKKKDYNKAYAIKKYNEENTIDYNGAVIIKEYEKAFNETQEYEIKKSKKKKCHPSESNHEFIKKVKKIKEHIRKGDIFQCVLSRTFRVKTKENSLDIYTRLKKINPGPYMFYFNNRDFSLIGSSPETCLKVKGGMIEIKPIAGTIKRGNNPELDSRYELDLILNEKELAEHCMLLDLARNDVAKVSIAGTRTTPQLLRIEKFSHVQHLVSLVEGKLRPELDAFHAYIATMNMGTLTGAPKIKAMEIIRKNEKDSRGLYGGAVCYITSEGDFDSSIIIRAMTIKNELAEVRAGAGIVFDSDPSKEAEETRKKAQACLAALGVEE